MNFIKSKNHSLKISVCILFSQSLTISVCILATQNLTISLTISLCIVKLSLTISLTKSVCILVKQSLAISVCHTKLDHISVYHCTMLLRCSHISSPCFGWIFENLILLNLAGQAVCSVPSQLSREYKPNK